MLFLVVGSRGLFLPFLKLALDLLVVHVGLLVVLIKISLLPLPLLLAIRSLMLSMLLVLIHVIEVLLCETIACFVRFESFIGVCELLKLCLVTCSFHIRMVDLCELQIDLF